MDSDGDHGYDGGNVNEEEENDNEDDDDINIDGDNNNDGDDPIEVDRIDIFDPRYWNGLSSDQIKVLVANGPKRDKSIEKGPKDKLHRRFSAASYTRILPNKEKSDKVWLVYSKELDRVFCFCFKVLRKGHSKGQLANEGFSDWQHLNTRLKEHEVCLEHLTNMATWFDMRRRLKRNETIDKVAHKQFEKERDHWKQVLLRIISLVKFLAKNNLAFRGSNERLYQNSNGNFLGLIEMLAEFDPIIKEHVRRITRDEIHVHYLGHRIHNELILLLANAIKSEIIRKVKEAKYYSVILDCTPDSSHQEHMSLILRYVNVSYQGVSVEESSLGFLLVEDTTGQGLFNITHAELKSLDLDIDDILGQECDIGSNMKGKHQGVETFLESYNAFYTIFANSTKRWKVLKDNVKGLTLKSLSTTRWESRIDSVKAIRFQISDIREALLQVAEIDNDPITQSAAKSLATNELGDFDFLVSVVIWFEILFTANLVSKKLQAKDMLLDVAINEVKLLISYFEDYRLTGFAKAIDSAKQIAIELNIDPVFPQKHVIHRKRHFNESSSDQDVLLSAEESFRINYFLYIIDQATASLTTRFQQYQEYEKVFGFLFKSGKLKSADDDNLKLHCNNLEVALTNNGLSDIDANDLYMELKLLNKILPSQNLGPADILYFLKQGDCLPNAIIAYRVLLTIPVTVTSAEQSFSKLKLLKSYMRSTMSQERFLNGLAMITVENELSEHINYEELINNFASKNARRMALFKA